MPADWFPGFWILLLLFSPVEGVDGDDVFEVALPPLPRAGISGIVQPGLDTGDEGRRQGAGAAT